MKKGDDGTIDLRKGLSDEEPEFKIGKVERKGGGGDNRGGEFSGGGGKGFSEERDFDDDMMGSVEVATPSELKESSLVSSSMVKVKFDKFVSLVATHAYQEVFEKHEGEDIIISTDLLADLANAHEEKSDKKVPLLFICGILLGAVIVWFLFKS